MILVTRMGWLMKGEDTIIFKAKVLSGILSDEAYIMDGAYLVEITGALYNPIVGRLQKEHAKYTAFGNKIIGESKRRNNDEK